MSKLFLDHHDQVHFDPTPDGRLAREAATPKAILLMLNRLERTHTENAKRALSADEDVTPHVRVLAGIESLRERVMTYRLSAGAGLAG